MAQKRRETPETESDASALALACSSDDACSVGDSDVRRDPWDRLDHETPKAYTAFLAYRDMGHTRTLLALTEQLYPTPVRLAHAQTARLTGYNGLAVSSQLAAWSSRYNWVERATAWDDNLLKQRELAIIDSLRHDAMSSVEREQTLRSNRHALAGRLRSRLTKLADGGTLSPADSKAHRELVLAVERLQIVEDGCDRGLEPVKQAITAKAVPQHAQSDLPATIPPDVAASVLALLAAVNPD